MCIVIMHRVIVLSEQYRLSHPTDISLCVCVCVRACACVRRSNVVFIG